MTGFFIMLRANLKLIMRNRASIFLVFLLPLASTLMLKLPEDRGDLEDSNAKMSIQIFDNSSSQRSKELINELESSGSFIITISEDTVEDLALAREKAVNIANRSTTNAIVFIPSSFSEDIVRGNTESLITIFSTGRDERVKVLESNINTVLSRFNMYYKFANGDKAVVQALLKNVEEQKTSRELMEVSSTAKGLSDRQKYQIFNLGYLVAIMAIVLMFSGNFISSIFIEEKNNQVLKRISLTNSSLLNYAIVKAALAMVVLIVQVIMVSIGIRLFVNMDIGMSFIEMSVLILGLGIIFNTLSLAIGNALGNMGSANYVTFFITTLSSLMSGLYFPLEITPKWIQNAALLMPQRWVIKTAEQLLLGTGTAILLFAVVVIGYMLLFLTFGFLGLKLNSK
jgi:ABC-2 type transport system permease protein